MKSILAIFAATMALFTMPVNSTAQYRQEYAHAGQQYAQAQQQYLQALEQYRQMQLVQPQCPQAQERFAQANQRYLNSIEQYAQALSRYTQPQYPAVERVAPQTTYAAYPIAQPYQPPVTQPGQYTSVGPGYRYTFTPAGATLSYPGKTVTVTPWQVTCSTQPESQWGLQQISTDAICAIIAVAFLIAIFLFAYVVGSSSQPSNAPRGGSGSNPSETPQSPEPPPNPWNDWLNRTPPPPLKRSADRNVDSEQKSARRAREIDPELEELLQLIEASLLAPSEKEAASREAMAQYRSVLDNAGGRTRNR